jgi:glutaredoxin
MKYNIYIIIMDNNMNIEKPVETGFTIYSKSGCPNCMRIKKTLTEKKQTFIEINCDEYLIEDKESFLSFIKNLAQKESKVFPMIFNNGTFIGSFNETQEFLDKQLSFDENNGF